MNSILCDYVSSSPLDLVPKLISILSRQSSHSYPYKSKNNHREQEFIINSGLRLSYLDHSNEIEIQLINEVTSSGNYFMVQSNANSLHRIPSLALTYPNVLDHCVCIKYKVSRIHSVIRISYSTLSLYYRPFKLISNINPSMSLHTVQNSSNNIGC